MRDLQQIPQNQLGLSLTDYISSSSALSRKNELSRIQLFETWLHNVGNNLLQANLKEYRNYLLGPERQLSPTSANVHLNSIRGRYRRMMKSDTYRNVLGQLAITFAESNDIRVESLADQMALVNEMEKRIENRIFADDVFARDITLQDEADENKGIRLTEAQATQLIRTPDVTDIRGLRDASILSVMICTGAREHEVIAIQVDDLHTHYESNLALRIRAGKGAKQRLVPYGSLVWCLDYVQAWLTRANITTGAVFRGFWGDSSSIRPSPLSVRQINRILAQYPISINGQYRTLRPHDLRRTYAKIQFVSGMKPEALQQNMGHASYDTTLRYIGDVNADMRMSNSSMPMPHSRSQLMET